MIFRKFQLLPLLLALLSGTLLLENILLQMKNANLRKQVEVADHSIQASVGDFVPPLRGHVLSGETVNIPFPKTKDTLILVFSRYCAWCDQNWPHWEGILAKQLEANPVLVDLSVGADKKYLDSHHVANLPLIHEIDPALLSPYKLRLTPQTILVSPDQHIRGVWTGELTEKDVDSITALVRSDESTR